jgi:hypothetical protein
MARIARAAATAAIIVAVWPIVRAVTWWDQHTLR